MASLLAFVVVAGVGIRTLRYAEAWDLGGFHYIGMVSGCMFYTHATGSEFNPLTDHSGHVSWAPGFSVSSMLKFLVVDIPDKQTGLFMVNVPLWFPLILLLIAPVCWLMARTTGGAAFPVITDDKRE